jgi:hypothetical protein
VGGAVDYLLSMRISSSAIAKTRKTFSS